MVVTFIFMFLFGLSCIATSVPYAISNHLCNTGEDLINLTYTLPSSCVDNSDTLTYLNQCLMQNVTSEQLLEDIDVQDLFQNIKRELSQNTSALLLSLRNAHCQNHNLSTSQITNLEWETAGEIASSEQIIQTIQNDLQSISQGCPSVQSKCNTLSKGLMTFGALIQIVNCGPLSAFYIDIVENSFCEDLNSNLLFISICIAVVIILMIPILMISFKFGFRPWTNDHQQLPVLIFDKDNSPPTYQSLPPTYQSPPPTYQSIDNNNVPTSVQFEVNVPSIPSETDVYQNPDVYQNAGRNSTNPEYLYTYPALEE